MNFLGYNFHKLCLEDKDVLEAFLLNNCQPITGFSFRTLIAWSVVYRYQWCFPDKGTLLIACEVNDSGEVHLLQPIGEFSVQVQQHLLENIRLLPYSLRMFGINLNFIKQYMGFIANFNLREDRGGANYIYLASELVELSGRKFQKKRNLISQAARSYSWSVEILSQQLVPDCFKVLENLEKDESDSAVQEMKTVVFSLQNLAFLKQTGILIRVDNEPVAFSIFEKMNENTVVVYIEKALRTHKGLYQIINQETAKIVLAQGYTYINREEDLNDEGLRQAKLSYNPVFLESSFMLCSSCYVASDGVVHPCERAW